MPQQPAPARSGINAGMVIAGIVVVALVIGGIAILGSKGSDPGKSLAPASPSVTQVPATPTPVQPTFAVVISPSTLSCSSPVDFTMTTRLPASVHTGDTISATFDGETTGTAVLEVGDSTVLEPDGSWLDTSTTTAAKMESICAAGGSNNGVNVLTPGTHTLQVVDANGNVLAEGSYTVVAPKATPAPSAGAITFSPPTVTCSTPIDFSTTIYLPASVKSGETVTEKLDGKSIGSGIVTADDATVQQADGSWILSSSTTASRMTDVCAAGGVSNGNSVLTKGTHTLQVFDANGKLLAQGSYVVN